MCIYDEQAHHHQQNKGGKREREMALLGGRLHLSLVLTATRPRARRRRRNNEQEKVWYVLSIFIYSLAASFSALACWRAASLASFC